MLLLKSPVSMKGAGSSVRGLLTQQFRLNDEIPALVRIEHAFVFTATTTI